MTGLDFLRCEVGAMLAFFWGGAGLLFCFLQAWPPELCDLGTTFGLVWGQQKSLPTWPIY